MILGTTRVAGVVIVVLGAVIVLAPIFAMYVLAPLEILRKGAYIVTCKMLPPLRAVRRRAKDRRTASELRQLARDVGVAGGAASVG